MKKYISILSLVAAFVLQSCDRSDLIANPDGQTMTRGQRPQEKTTLSSENLNQVGHLEMTAPETGDDDEPRKDKSHWRLANDTILP